MHCTCVTLLDYVALVKEIKKEKNTENINMNNTGSNKDPRKIKKQSLTETL